MTGRHAGRHSGGHPGRLAWWAFLCCVAGLAAVSPPATASATGPNAGAASGVGGVGGSGGGSGGGGVGGARLVLTVDSRSSGRVRVELTCYPDGGTHPHPDVACAALARVGGRPQDLTGDPHTLCMALYDPVIARAEGNWFGNQVLFDATYPNRCMLVRDTAGVFDF